jgi:hypothetical protein
MKKSRRFLLPKNSSGKKYAKLVTSAVIRSLPFPRHGGARREIEDAEGNH